MSALGDPLESLTRRELIETVKANVEIIESLSGHIRRLEKSNQELGEQLHRLGPGEGWNKNV